MEGPRSRYELNELWETLKRQFFSGLEAALQESWGTQVHHQGISLRECVWSRRRSSSQADLRHVCEKVYIIRANEQDYKRFT